MADLNDNVLESEYSKKEFNIDAHLKYGRYQAIRVWIFGSILGASSVLFYRFTKNILNVFKQNCSKAYYHPHLSFLFLEHLYDGINFKDYFKVFHLHFIL